ncbi:MAG: flippase-like domain-containing protein, partial [Acidobacteria bacterium]|nr:flippase-like domain-containing protein [Acidobacteriota bacterium]
MNVSLLRALRIVIAADSDPVRQVLFANLMQARRLVRLAYRLHAQFAGTWVSAVVISGYGLAYFLRISPPAARRSILAVAKHANARRQVDRVGGWVGLEHYHRIRIRFESGATMAGLSRLASAASGRALWRSLRIIHVLDRRYGFLVACRSAAAIAWYARTKAMLAEHRPGAVLVSSDSNPEEVGFTAAAAALAVPHVFVSHAYPTPFSPPLNFSLSILEGEAAVRSRMRRGTVSGDIVLAGVDGDSAPLDLGRFDRKEPVIGIFTPKAISWPTLAAIIDDCRRVFGARGIVIRWHPSRLDQVRHLHSLSDLSGIEESPMSAALPDVARRCDWVIADENSNVHLPVLKLGIPTVVVKGLGVYPESRSDMYGFAAAGIVFPAVRSIRDLRAPEFKAFFENGWVSRFRQYDASYLRPQAEIQAEVRRAIWRVIEAPPESAAGGDQHETPRQSDDVTPVRGGWTARIAALFSLVVSGALLVMLYRSLDVGLVAQALLQADAAWLAISVGMIVPITYLRAVRFYWVAPPGALPGTAEAFRLTLVASALNVFLPAKAGDLVKSYFVATRSNTAAGVALSMVVYERLCDLFGLIACCLV